MSYTAYAFLLVFLGGLALCVARGPMWGLYTYLAVFYLDPPDRWWGHSLPDLRWSLVAASVTLLCVLFRRRDTTRAPFFSYGLPRIVLLLVVWMWIQVPFAISDERLIGPTLFTKYFVLLYLIYEIVDSEDRVRDFLFAHVVGCFYLGWLAYTAVGGGRLEGVGGPGINDSNTMSMHFGTAVVIAAVLLLTERRWRFWVVLGAMPFMLNGMIQGSSRGAFLGLAVGALCLMWLKPPGQKKRFLAFSILGAFLFAHLANGFFVHRMKSLEAVTSDQQQLDFSAASRLVILKAQWHMFLGHPMGVGYRGTTALSPNYLAEEYLAVDPKHPNAPRKRSSHNTYMSVVVNQGVIGIALLTALLLWVWRSTGLITRRSNQEARAWAYGTAVAAALTVAAVAGLFEPYLKAEVQIWMLGLMLSLRTLREQRLADRAGNDTYIAERQPEPALRRRRTVSGSPVKRAMRR